VKQMVYVPAKTIQAKSKSTAVKFTPDQYRAIQQRAERSGLRVGVWMRSVLLQAANSKADKGYLRIREPDGATT
jgi:mobilization protein NikA